MDSHDLQLYEYLEAVPDTDWDLRFRAAIRCKSFQDIEQEPVVVSATMTVIHFVRGIVDTASADSSVSEGERAKETYVHAGPLFGSMGVMEGTRETFVHGHYRARYEPMSVLVSYPSRVAREVRSRPELDGG